jgi:hypothetical protein
MLRDAVLDSVCQALRVCILLCFNRPELVDEPFLEVGKRSLAGDVLPCTVA